MNWYYYIAWAVAVSQIPFLVFAIRNYLYAIAKYKKKRAYYTPRTAVIIPCKNLDRDFDRNIASFFAQDYDSYILWFVVADKEDPAYHELRKLTEELRSRSKAKDVQIFVSGQGQSCSQKVHNLLYCYRRIPGDVEVLAFADSDICVRSDWLRHLVNRLRLDQNGATSGYRWFIPKTNNLATLALSAINARVAQLLGNTRCNQAWGGSMAIKVQTFRELKLDEIWPKTLSDDLSLSWAVKSVRKKVEYVPGCLAPSYESTTWATLFEFARRQFIITRVAAPGTWWFGLISMLYSVLSLWVTTALALYARKNGDPNVVFYAAVPIIVFARQFASAILRQRMAGKLLWEHRPKMRFAAAADVLLFWIWSALLLLIIISSAFGRTICWRGIRYKLLGPNLTVVLHR
jgi:cellulose synthase/poly-beta-1,6-N-acetylglucosamine synthase-like glycosyltransferase